MGLRDEHEHGAWFVDLVPIRDPALVLPAIAEVLGVRESAEQPLGEALLDHLKERELLLVLDNVEQVVEAAPAVGELLRACPRLTVLATSRAALRIGWERELPLAPLPVPDPARRPPVDDLA